jgi:hypothetical protein
MGKQDDKASLGARSSRRPTPPHTSPTMLIERLEKPLCQGPDVWVLLVGWHDYRVYHTARLTARHRHTAFRSAEGHAEQGSAHKQCQHSAEAGVRRKQRVGGQARGSKRGVAIFRCSSMSGCKYASESEAAVLLRAPPRRTCLPRFVLHKRLAHITSTSFCMAPGPHRNPCLQEEGSISQHACALLMCAAVAREQFHPENRQRSPISMPTMQ